MGMYYVDNSLHPAANATGNATGGGAGHILLRDAGVQSDDAFNGYGILIVSGTGVGQQRRILDFDFTGHPAGERCATVDATWTTVPDASSVYEITVGCDANSGGSAGAGATGAWRTIDRALRAMVGAGTGTQYIHIKGPRPYLETATVDTPRTAGNPVIVQGYQAAPGDGGRATIDGENSRSFGIICSVTAAVNYAFRNLSAVNCTSKGFELTNASTVRLLNCRAENNGSVGFSTGVDTILVGCEAVGNALYGFTCPLAGAGLATLFYHCEGRGNGNQQFRGGSMILIHCTARQVADAKRAVGTVLSSDGAYLINCTIDGAGSAGATGMYIASGARYVALNSIFNNLDQGIQAAGVDDLRLVRNNLFHNCAGGAMVNLSSDGGDVFADPCFVAPQDGNLRPAIGSPALRTGYPPSIDMGSVQHESKTPLGGPCRLGMQA